MLKIWDIWRPGKGCPGRHARTMGLAILYRIVGNPAHDFCCRRTRQTLAFDAPIGHGKWLRQRGCWIARSRQVLHRRHSSGNGPLSGYCITYLPCSMSVCRFRRLFVVFCVCLLCFLPCLICSVPVPNPWSLLNPKCRLSTNHHGSSVAQRVRGADACPVNLQRYRFSQVITTQLSDCPSVARQKVTAQVSSIYLKFCWTLIEHTPT